MIDVHHHIIPKQAPQSLNFPKWSIEEDLETMDRLGIEVSLLSVPFSGNSEMILRINEHLASLVQYNTNRYGFFASLSLENIDSTLGQVEFAYQSLQAEGFILPTNYNGLYLGSEKLVPLLDELDRRNAVVLIHPTAPSGDNFPTFNRDLSVYEYPLETTRAVMDMIYNDRLTQFPNIKWIISHAGGTIPFLSHRLSIAHEWNGVLQNETEVFEAISSLYFDLALSTANNVYQCLKSVTSKSHILLGTDYPLRQESGVSKSLNHINNTAVFTQIEKQDILVNNAHRLFPRFLEKTKLQYD